MNIMELIRIWFEDNDFPYKIINNTKRGESRYSSTLDSAKHLAIEVSCISYIDIYDDGNGDIDVYGVAGSIKLKAENPEFFAKLKDFIDESVLLTTDDHGRAVSPQIKALRGPYGYADGLSGGELAKIRNKSNQISRLHRE